MAPRRREAEPSAGAHGRAGARRARRPRARQRPLPDQLLGDEGVRRGRLPARGRARPDLPRGVRGRRGADELDERRADLPRLRRERPATARPARARPGAADRLGVRPGRSRAQPGHAGRGPDGRRADDVPEGLVRRVPQREGRDPAPRRRPCGQDRAGGRADAARERDRGAGARAHGGALAPAHDRERGRGALAGLGARARDRPARQGRARARLLARLVRAGHPHLHGDRATGRSASTSRPCSRSGSARTATGATTRRTSSRATRRRATASSRSSCSASTGPRSTTAGPVQACPSSTG